MKRIFTIFLLMVLIPAAQLAIMVVIMVTVVEKIVSTWWVDKMLVQRSYEEISGSCWLVYLLLIFLYYLFLFIMYWIKNSNHRMILTLLFWIVPSVFCANQFLPLGNSFVSLLAHLCYNGVYYLPFLLPNSLGLINIKKQFH